MPLTLADIRAAAARIDGRVYRSPCVPSNHLSELVGATTYLKLENLQQTGSFKERGACNRLLQLTGDERARGVICASAGNHAQGLAYHGRQLGVPVTVVMPKWAPLVKVNNCRRHQAQVVLHGETFHEAREKALLLAAENGRVFVPPFDDERIIAGAGTVGLEVIEEVPDVDAVFVPAGGGGLLAGVVTAIKSQKPGVKIYGVESAAAPTVHASLAAGRVELVPTQPTLADGLAVAEMGRTCFDLIRGQVEKIVLVDEARIASAILRLLEVEKTLVEGAGAIALAAAQMVRDEIAGKKVALILCGGNIDVTVLSRIIDRGLRTDGRLCRILTRMSDRPGNLSKFTAVVAAQGGSIKDVLHDRHFGPPDVARISVSCTVETQGFDHIARIMSALEEEGLDAQLDD